MQTFFYVRYAFFDFAITVNKFFVPSPLTKVYKLLVNKIRRTGTEKVNKY